MPTRFTGSQIRTIERLVLAGYVISLYGPLAVRVLEGRVSDLNPRFLAEILGADHPPI